MNRTKHHHHQQPTTTTTKYIYKTIDISNVLTRNEIVCNKCEYEIYVCLWWREKRPLSWKTKRMKTYSILRACRQVDIVDAHSIISIVSCSVVIFCFSYMFSIHPCRANLFSHSPLSHLICTYEWMLGRRLLLLFPTHTTHAFSHLYIYNIHHWKYVCCARKRKCNAI